MRQATSAAPTPWPVSIIKTAIQAQPGGTRTAPTSHWQMVMSSGYVLVRSRPDRRTTMPAAGRILMEVPAPAKIQVSRLERLRRASRQHSARSRRTEKQSDACRFRQQPGKDRRREKLPAAVFVCHPFTGDHTAVFIFLTVSPTI